MGCTAAKNVTVEQIETNADEKLPNKTEDGEQKETVDETIPLSLVVDTLSPIEVETLSEVETLPDVEILADAETHPENVPEPVVNNLQQKISGLSFDIAFEEDEESIIKKHPPKRFQSLEDRPSSPVTLEKLQEKLEEAEVRRQQILTQRIQSAKQRNGIKKQNSVESEHGDNEHLEEKKEDPEALHLSDV